MNVDDSLRRSDREKEMLLIMINGMRNHHLELYTRSFISGTTLKNLNAVSDLVSDFALINLDKQQERSVRLE